MRLKSPLRYPGGKTRAVKFLAERLPSISQYREPFIGGGSMAIYVTQKYLGVPVWVNDLHYPLYCFWITLRDNAERMQKDLYDIKSNMNDDKDKSKEIFNQSKSLLDTEEDPYLVGLHFYVINKCGFSGLSQSSSFSYQASTNNFTKKSIDKLVEYGTMISGWRITNLDYSELLDGDDAFVFLDPPYEIGKTYLYGKGGDTHRGFDHDKFAEKCNSSSNKMMITYNSDSKIKNRFDEWNTEEWDLTYTMRSTGDYGEKQKDRKELLLTNYEERTRSL